MRAALTSVLILGLLSSAPASAQDGGATDAGVAEITDPALPPAANEDGEDALPAAVADAGAPEVDAGAAPPDAGPAADEEETPSTASAILEALGLIERTEEAGRAAQRANERLDEQETREADGADAGELVVPVRFVEEVPVSVAEEIPVRVTGCEPGQLGFDLPERKLSTPALVVLIFVALLAVWLLDRARKPLPDRGFVPRTLGLLHLAARAATVIMIIMLATRLLPGWLRPALLFTIGAAALAVGAGSVWVLLPDIVGGILLVTEGRLRPGLWVVGDGFAGIVERVGPRLTTLRAPDGTKLSIPNRRLVKSPIHASDRRWHEVEVELTVPSGFGAPDVRRAVEDAVLCSPFVPPEPSLTVTRDPENPRRWKVRARVLDATYVDRFEGQLLERVEEGLDLL